MANNLAVIEGKGSSQQIAPAFTFNDMQAMATSFAQGGMFGSNNPHAVLSLMLVAQAEGKHPAQIMQDYHVVQGKPAKKADAMLRDFIGSGGKVEWHELTDDIADATFAHPQGGSVRITWDEKRVQQAQLGGNAMHKKYPRQMKRARCVSEGVRTVFPGATGGFYVPEEVVDFDDKPKAEAKRARNVTNEVSDDKRAKAEEWVSNHIAEIADADDWQGVADKAIRAVAKLKKDHPDLMAGIEAAYAAREQEGGASEGENTDTPSSDDLLAELAGAIEQAATAEELDAAAARVNENEGSLYEDDLADLDAAIAAKRRKVK